MITLNASGGSVTFTFSGNSTYLNDGVITCPVNSLALIIDESDMITLKKSASNDIFVSANIAEFGMTKAELESWFKENAVGSTGGGGGGITSGEVQTMIDESISGKADSSAVTEEISAAVSGKQDTLIAGRGISITTGETADTVSFNLPISAGTGENSIAEGYQTSATSTSSHAEGYNTIASDYYSHAEGHQTSATSISSHAEGYITIASGSYSHAEGYNTIASNSSSHVEGGNNTASGAYSHAEGQHTIASGRTSHAEGEYSKTNGRNSHAEGDHTIANNQSEHASGYWNISNTGSTDADKTLFSVGNGAWDDTLQETVRHNAFEIRKNGDIYITKDGTDIKLQDQLGGGCEVEETVVYDTKTSDYYDYNGNNKLTYVMLDYQGDKSTADNVQLLFYIGDYSDEYNSWIYFDYVNHSANTDSLSDYVTVEYISEVQDFKVSVASAYQSTYWIKVVSSVNNERAILIPFYTINSGSPCTVIATDVVGLVEKVKDKAYEALSECSLQSSEDIIYLDANHINGSSSRNTIKLEELDGSSSTLKPNIQVGLGVSGWTEMTFNESCNTNGNPKTPIIRLSGDTNSLDTFNTQWLINLEHYGNTYDSVIWSGSEFVFNSNWFGENGELGTATVTYDDANNTLTIAYPLTAQVYGYTDNVELRDIYNQNCQFGTAITKLEYYAEQTQPLKPYVQETRAALGGLKLSHVTQAQYDAMEQGGTLDSNTLYVITDN